jgi:hypothetical protein
MKLQFSILDLLRVTTCVGFVLCGVVSFEIDFGDVVPLLKQLFTTDKAGTWTGVTVDTTGRAILLGVAMGVALIMSLSHWMLSERIVGIGNEKRKIESNAPSGQ